MRGTVSLAGIHLGADGSFSLGSEVSPEQLRAWAILWDKVSVPEIAQFQFGRSDDFIFLKDAGLIEERLVDVAPGDVVDMYRDARRSVFEHWEEAMPGAWSMSTGMSEDGVDPQHRALRVHLAAALPIAMEDVPLDEVLRFKERHKDLRDQLFSLIDEAYLSVLSSPDKPVSQHVAMEKLLLGAREHLDEFERTGWNYKLMDIAADFNIAPAIVTALTMGTAAAAMGTAWPMVVGNSVLAGASVSVSQVAALFKRRDSKSPYRYLSAFREEAYDTSD